MNELKGTGRVVLRCDYSGGVAVLLLHLDGSWSIQKNDRVVGTWEPQEKADCLRIFGQMCGLQDPATQALLRMRPEERVLLN